jgi:large subunit ribosomal protein L25
MENFEIVAQARADQGKGASRRLRHAGLVPGVVYGAGKEPAAVQTSHKDLLQHLEHEAFFSHILALRIGESSERVVLKDLQRHPYLPQVLHFDLLRVDENRALTMRVPLHFANEAKCAGVKAGGIVTHLMNELEILCLPRDLPEFIEVDIATLNIGHAVHIGDLKMPAGVRVAALVHGGDASQPVVTVQIPKAEVEEVPVAVAAEAAAAAPAEGAAAAPAAADAAAKPAPGAKPAAAPAKPAAGAKPATGKPSK